MQKIKWLGKEETLIRKELGGEQFEVKAGGSIDVQKEVAKDLKDIYGNRIEFLDNIQKAVVQKEVVKKAKKPFKK